MIQIIDMEMDTFANHDKDTKREFKREGIPPSLLNYYICILLLLLPLHLALEVNGLTSLSFSLVCTSSIDGSSLPTAQYVNNKHI